MYLRFTFARCIERPSSDLKVLCRALSHHIRPSRRCLCRRRALRSSVEGSAAQVSFELAKLFSSRAALACTHSSIHSSVFHCLRLFRHGVPMRTADPVDFPPFLHCE